MNMKSIVTKQYKENIEAARKRVGSLQIPCEGWLRTVRKALGMSGAQLARRMGVTRGAVSINEKAEIEGAITLKTMQQMASAMNCRFVYAVIPEQDVDEIIFSRARAKARKLVKEASVHMALEDQALSQKRLDDDIERTAKQLMDKPSNLWDDE